MSITENLQRIFKAGYTGFTLWNGYGNPNKIMGCLTKDYKPFTESNLWDYVPTAEEAVERLANIAEENPVE
jgi:hypothetical protein